MTRQHPHGFTLPEILIVVAFIGMVLTSVLTVSMQSSKIYSRMAVHEKAEAVLELALKRMEKVMREAMFIRVGSTSTAVEIALPLKDSGGKIIPSSIEVNPTTHAKALVRQEGKHICFFLGRYSTTNPTQAMPDGVNGNTIFMISSGTDATTGTDIISAAGTLSSSYTNAKEIITGINSVPTVPDPAHPGQALNAFIFTYSTSGTTSAFQDGLNSQILRVTLTMPIANGPSGEPIHDQTLSTQFCLRNFESLN
ncbi:MAG TPA: type II secretion system protein [Armatimonadota bacterium]|jgi:prepilin-type N-terminal cleavage/methylation domain-containing protein